MKKIPTFLLLATLSLIARAGILEGSPSKYIFEHQDISDKKDMKSGSENGKEYIASYKENSIAVVSLNDNGKSFLLQTKIGAKGKEFTLNPKRDILLYAVNKKRKRTIIKQYTTDKIKKAYEKETINKIMSGTYQPPSQPVMQNSEKPVVVTYRDGYGQKLGTATVSEENEAGFSPIFNSIGGIVVNIKAKKAAKNRIKNAIEKDVQVLDNIFWQRHTFYPNDVGDGHVLFQNKTAPSYELIIKLGEDEHIFNFNRVKK